MSYIGQSQDLYQRLINHKSKLIKNKNNNTFLQNDYNNNNNCLRFKILEYCDVESLKEKEEYYIKSRKWNSLYNQSLSFKSNRRGIKSSNITSKKTKNKLSLSKKGKKPENLDQIQQQRRKKIAYYVNEKLIKIFDSCKEAAFYFGIKPNAFDYYIGKKIAYKQKGKYFKKPTKFIYYE